MKTFMFVFLLSFASVCDAVEWNLPTLEIGGARHAPNVYDYEWNYGATLQQCTKSEFCMGYSHSTTTTPSYDDEVFNKVYINKRWTLGE